MSRSNPDVRLESPCKRYFEWNGDAGGFKYFDKAKDAVEKGTGNIAVPLPFTFLVIDELITIGGFSESANSRFWSNEIRKRDLKTGVLTVKNGKGVCCSGTYESIKGKETGMKYCESVYIAYRDDKGALQIGNIKFAGAGLSSWIDFVSGTRDDKGKRLTLPSDPYKGAIKVASMLEGKKGKTTYQMPVFTVIPIKDETDNEVKDMDRELQAYLKLYFNAANVDSDLDAMDKKMEDQPSVRESASNIPNQDFSGAIQAEDDLPF